MSLSEDLSVFLGDFGVSVTAGAVSGLGILDMPTEIVAGGQILSTDYTLLCRADEFGGLLYGAAITVDGVNYSVRENRLLDNGGFCEISLTKLAPDTVAPGSDPAQFTLNDLADVTITSPSQGEVLIYNGSQWVDGISNGAAFVHTQSVAATTWTINHNLGYRPSVELFTSSGEEFDADVLHTSVNQTLVYTNVATTGFARLV